MEERLDILHHLYGEADDPAALGRLLEDPARRAEYAALAEVKAALDRRPREAPEAAVVARVLAAAAVPPAFVTPAAPPAAHPAPRADRPALPRRARWPWLAGLTTTAAVLLLTVVLWPSVPADEASPRLPAPVAEAAPPEAAATDAAPPAVSPAPAATPAGRAAEAGQTIAVAPQQAPVRADRALPASSAKAEVVAESAAETLTAAPAGQALADRGRAPEELLRWDAGDDVQRLRRRIEMVQASSTSLEWDEPPVPLEALLGAPGRAPSAVPVLPAGTRRNQ